MSENPSIVGRISNLLTQAAEMKICSRLLPLPKLIVVVLDDAIVNVLSEKNCSTHRISKPISKLLNHIMTEYSRAIAFLKEFLPAKSVREGYPHLLWIQAPLHDNFAKTNNDLRYKFNQCLEEAVHFHSNMSTLELKRVWNPKDATLYLKDSQHFTADGYRTYWEAVNCTVRYCDSVLLKKQEKKKRAHAGGRHTGQKDRFHWQNPFLNRDHTQKKCSGSFPHRLSQRNIVTTLGMKINSLILNIMCDICSHWLISKNFNVYRTSIIFSMLFLCHDSTVLWRRRYCFVYTFLSIYFHVIRF